ncbi:malic-domain-containing protein [Hymenopellis radicata]|nr:malic-domain-containing protein [Hymenopellis radicata]
MTSRLLFAKATRRPLGYKWTDFPTSGRSNISCSSATHGSRILGLGDIRLTGMPLLYIAGASIRPSSTIPICLNLGTNNQKFLDDPLYLRLRQKRVPDEEMCAFMDGFMHEMSVTFPPSW